MTTATQDKTKDLPETDDGTTDSNDDVFHYVRKGDVVESAIEGKHVVALCGETFPVTKVFKKGSPICGECQRIYRKMKV